MHWFALVTTLVTALLGLLATGQALALPGQAGSGALVALPNASGPIQDTGMFSDGPAVDGTVDGTVDWANEGEGTALWRRRLALSA
jgi:hypothetical protein